MRIPRILFVCHDKSGCSQIAAGYVKLLSRDYIRASSAGPAPAEFIDPIVVEVMIEDGVYLTGDVPKPLTTDVIRSSDVLITFKCPDACPFFAGVHRCDRGDPQPCW
ncbi:uncharacterized protein N7529_008963 [Penicillium soppii]|jgi:arsenate reductase|uniref:uncharacterized protein n=1 Tax=Penicillium soppii TaxID=69789 RepID=UPI002547CFCB|nr:uncharacterized protein N7529_008963 [Penicillium soppii]KAJ5861653.1 hypothetical protein N7529_008963 [Penicillium soppii]